MMNIEKRLSDIVSDLGLERSFIKGQSVTVRNCWHFYTAGDAVDILPEILLKPCLETRRISEVG